LSEEARAARPPIRSYEDIEAYRRAMQLVARVHAVVRAFPSYEQRDLVGQMRRAAKSIPANIAEGYAKRSSTKEFRNYLRMAMASANEMEVHVKIAGELGYLKRDEADGLIADYVVVGKQLNRLISSWRQLQPQASSIQRPGTRR
jgi:four helix bundle protein